MTSRNERRKVRIKGPKGEWLYPQFLYIIDRDEKGRPKTCQIAYDEQEIGDVVPEDKRDKAEMILVFMGSKTEGFNN